jgi:hypothetical protein
MEKQTVTLVVNAKFSDKQDAAAFAAIASRRLLLMMASMERITERDYEVEIEAWVGPEKPKDVTVIKMSDISGMFPPPPEEPEQQSHQE